MGDFRKAWASACTAAGFVKPKLDRQGRPVLDRKGQAVAVAAFLFHDLRRSFAKDAVDAPGPTGAVSYPGSAQWP